MKVKYINQKVKSSRDLKVIDSYMHVILDLRVPNVSKFNILKAKEVIKCAAELGKLKVINIQSHKFTNHGFTVFALLSQSHIAIHTWPEYEYVACDIFSCGGELKKVIQSLVKFLKPSCIYQRFFPRGLPAMANVNTIFYDETGPGIQTLMNVQLIGRVHSKFQKIEIFKHENFGKMLVINDDIQFTENDYHLYNGALMSPLKIKNFYNSVLIVGGGDGLCCTYILKNKLTDRIELLEIDPSVVKISKKYFSKISKGLNSKKVNIVYGDASKTIKNYSAEKFDVVIIDVTAPDNILGQDIYSKKFFGEVKRVMTKDAVLCANGTSKWYKYFVTSNEIKKNIYSIFGNVSSVEEWIPSFGSPWSFFNAIKKGDQKNMSFQK